jgi:NADH-quinone oxidoreductase subunit G
MVTFTIDGRELSVPKGTTIMQAAHANGIAIPHYCYHPGLSIAGNCRICLVEVEKFPKPAIACNTVVTDGMVVHTQQSSEKAREWQKAVMEFLLINHPLDCPICDQAGECKLQDYSYKLGNNTTRFVEEKEHGPKRRTLGPHVVFDWERCIKCTRCIRFCDEVSGTSELGMFLRGVHEEIGVFPGRPLDNPYSGNVADICPVGALTVRENRFMPRVYFLSDVPSTCGGCSRGCSINLAVYRNEISRITPRENQAVNRWWICDEGRLWGHKLREADGARLSGPRGGSGDGPAADPWKAAVGAATELLQQAGDGRIHLLASPRASVEETFLLARIAAVVPGGAKVYLSTHERGEDDEVLIRKDRAPNLRGAREVLETAAGGFGDVAALERALEAGEVDVLLALGPGLTGPVDDEPPVIDPSVLGRAGSLVVLDAFPSVVSEAATVLLPTTSFAEAHGTYVNFAGRVQHSAKALTPNEDCRPAMLLLGDILAGLSGDPAPGRRDLQRMISLEIPAFSRIDWDALPASTGQDLEGTDAAASACTLTGAAQTMLENGWDGVPTSPRGKPPWIW